MSLWNDDLISFWFLVFALRAGLNLCALIDLYMYIHNTYSTMSSNLSNWYFLKSGEVWALYLASARHLISLLEQWLKVSKYFHESYSQACVRSQLNKWHVCSIPWCFTMKLKVFFLCSLTTLGHSKADNFFFIIKNFINMLGSTAGSNKLSISLSVLPCLTNIKR